MVQFGNGQLHAREAENPVASPFRKLDASAAPVWKLKVWKFPGEYQVLSLTFKAEEFRVCQMMTAAWTCYSEGKWLIATVSIWLLYFTQVGPCWKVPLRAEPTPHTQSVSHMAVPCGNALQTEAAFPQPLPSLNLVS